MAEKYAIGIDVGGTNTKFGVVNKNGEILIQDRIKTNEKENVEGFIEVLAEKLQPMIDQYGGPEAFVGIGMGAPNANYYQGTIEYAANLKWKGIIPMADIMEEKFKIQTKLTNDANAAAVGEMQYGIAKGMKNFITITLGTGVGSGVIIDGKIVLGYNGFAGELGHVIVRNGGRLHQGTGLCGSLESYASATGVRDTAIEFLQANPDINSLLSSYTIDELTSETVFKCAEQGDVLANEARDQEGEVVLSRTGDGSAEDVREEQREHDGREGHVDQTLWRSPCLDERALGKHPRVPDDVERSVRNRLDRVRCG